MDSQSFLISPKKGNFISFQDHKVFPKLIKHMLLADLVLRPPSSLSSSLCHETEYKAAVPVEMRGHSGEFQLCLFILRHTCAST